MRCLAYQQHEGRDVMYKVARFLVEHFWGESSEMADGLGVLLLTWNQALYRYAPFDFDRLEECLVSNQGLLDEYHRRSILSYSAADNGAIEHLFGDFLVALQQVPKGDRTPAKSPVAVAKALHLLAPDFFPLWDKRIAQKYGHNYSRNPARKYLLFVGQMKQYKVEK